MTLCDRYNRSPM